MRLELRLRMTQLAGCPDQGVDDNWRGREGLEVLEGHFPECVTMSTARLQRFMSGPSMQSTRCGRGAFGVFIDLESICGETEWANHVRFHGEFVLARLLETSSQEVWRRQVRQRVARRHLLQLSTEFDRRRLAQRLESRRQDFSRGFAILRRRFH